MSSLACKCTFCRPEHIAKKLDFECLEMQKWNIPTDRTPRVDENGVICLFTCLLPDLRSLKCQKWLILCIFCWWKLKISHSLGIIFRYIWKILFSLLRKRYGLLGSELPYSKMLTLENTRFRYFLADLSVLFFISLPSTSHER